MIVGYKTRTKDFGPSMYYKCQSCTHTTYHAYTRVRLWFTLFFIPLLPLWTADYYATCANCGHSHEIEAKADAKNYKKASKLSTNFLKDASDSDDYWPTLHSLMADCEDLTELPKSPPTKQPDHRGIH